MARSDSFGKVTFEQTAKTQGSKPWGKSILKVESRVYPNGLVVYYERKKRVKFFF